jgi:cytochrome oxidase Cu insertion factor (SCO1/SenC/PrrC family)
MRHRWRIAATALLIGGIWLGVAAAQRPAPQPGAAGRGNLRTPDRIKEGDVAPDFTLKSPDGKKTVTLSSFKGKKPVALVFGSYT